jgi:acyl carrier protein
MPLGSAATTRQWSLRSIVKSTVAHMTSNPSTVEDRIRMALADYLKRPLAKIDPRQSLRDDLGLDSMATIELLFRIEEVFDLQIPDQDLIRLVTVADVIAYVEEKVSPPAPAHAKSTRLSAQRTTGKKSTAKKTR